MCHTKPALCNLQDLPSHERGPSQQGASRGGKGGVASIASHAGASIGHGIAKGSTSIGDGLKAIGDGFKIISLGMCVGLMFQGVGHEVAGR